MLEDYLHSYFQDIEIQKIFVDVIGTSNKKEIQALLNNVLNKYFQTELKDILFIESSIGVVFGLLLSNNKKLALKVYSKKISLKYLKKMNEIQMIFHRESFPAPQTLTPIFRFEKTYAGFYEFIEGNKENAHENEICIELAQHLAKFSSIVDKYNLKPMENFFQQASKRNIWPTPHNVLFNLKKTAKGAGWIAENARRAKTILANSQLPQKLAHTDWGTKNALFRAKKLVGIFDWDSLGAMSECQMLGQAAAQFTADWDSGFKITPSPAEGKKFVKTYENYREIKFSEQEYKIISASSDYLIAIIARFEHAGKRQEYPYQTLLKECKGKSFLFA